jgi:flagellar motor switch protein FliG
MRKQIAEVGDNDREFLPQWMRSIQDFAQYELGYTKALTLCYAKPGSAASIVTKIKANGFDFKSINFTADRYIIDIIDGEIEDKYLAFPQRGEKLP